MEELEVRHEWAGFDLLKVGGEKLVFWKEGGVVVLSGCITTTWLAQFRQFGETVGNQC